MKIVTGQLMKEADQEAIQKAGVPGLLLMEHAGLGVIREMESLLGSLSGKVVSIVVGKGNNGGDGLVVARHLLGKGATPRVYLTCDPYRLKGDAKVNLSLFRQWGGDPSVLSAGSLRSLKKDFSDSELIIDALFGTGLSSPIEGMMAQVVRCINASGIPVLAVDMPSGVHSDSGKILGVAVKAHMTVTLGLPKQGCFFFPGADCVGMLKVVDIGIPPSILRNIKSQFHLLTPDWIASKMPGRPLNSHKGLFGHVAVIAGSQQTTGSGLLSSLAALRSGAGLATLAIPSSLHKIVASQLMEVMTCPLPETQAQTLSTKAEGTLLSLVKRKKAMVIGPGLSTHPETQELVHRFLSQVSLPVVLDADGLNVFAGHLSLLKKIKAPTVLTPHPGEMSRLMETTVAAVEADRLGSARALAREVGHCVVLKGSKSLIVDPNGTAYLNPTGNPGMATAGIGDALTGVIGALLAQGLSAFEAAAVGTFIHGVAGDLAAADQGVHGLITRDLIEQLPKAFLKIPNFCPSGA